MYDSDWVDNAISYVAFVVQEAKSLYLEGVHFSVVYTVYSIILQSSVLKPLF